MYIKWELHPTLQVRKFTTRTKFENYGDTIGLNLRKQLAIADRLRFVADSAGLTSTVTDSSQVPAWYNIYAQSLTGNFHDNKSDNRFLGTSLAKDGSESQSCRSWNGYNFVPGVVAFQPAFTFWNNKTSGVQNVDVYGAFHMWDRWFYRKYLGVVAGIPTTYYIPLCGTVADRKTSSAIRYGL